MKPRPEYNHFITTLCGSNPYLIFVTIITNEMCGEKCVMWRNLRFICMTDVEKSDISPHVEQFHISPHGRCGEI